MFPFARPHYTSDTTQFLAQLKEKNPSLEAEQREGRALLWDSGMNAQFQADASTARVPQQPYVYQTKA
ncbi:MAG: DUF3460 family protein [Hydrogenophaga sp.]|jgi:hypothetical protein|nr:DUF3460 family protein [Hydrogenophaga sp.]